MKLIVLKNNVPLNEVSLETSDAHEMYEIYVGRSEDCHVQIDDPLISRHHFVLRNEGLVWVCEKLSQLGVMTLNGQLVSKNPVQNGDEIKCGIYSILVAELSPLTIKQSAPVYAAAPEPVYAAPVYQAPEPEPEPVLALSDEDLTQSLDQDLSGEAPVEAPADDLNGLDDLSSLSDSEPQSESTDFGDSSLEGEGFESSVGEADFNAPVESSEDGFGMTETEGDSDANESTRVFKAFVNYQLIIFGEHAPYDRYLIDQDEIFIGRDPKKCQIILNDPEVSSVHAVIRKDGNDVTIEDLNSSNGTILNGDRINRAQLLTGDEFVIGGTSFSLEVKSDLLESEKHRLMPVEENQVIEKEEIEEEEITMEDGGDLGFSTEVVQEKSIFKRLQKDPAFRKKAIYVVAGLGLAFVLLYEEEPAPVVKTDQKPKETKVATVKTKPPLSKELENRRNIAYELGVNFFEQNKYFEALGQFQVVAEIDADYKKIQSYLEQTKIGLKRLEELEAQRRAEEERIKTKKMIEELLVKAREAVKERQIPVAENYFSQITEKDPENIEVQQLRLELETWQKEQERIALEKAAKEAARKKMVDALAPGKTYYLKKEWYRAILKLEEFLRIKGMDEDLVKEGSDMLSDAKNQLASDLGPLLGKARSLKEGQDLKAAYEAFLDVLKIEPTNSEALNEVDDIKNQLDSRSKKIYREAIIAESLSLFNDAKEKFQEVQQISPSDSEYYKKASEKLRNYLE